MSKYKHISLGLLAATICLSSLLPNALAQVSASPSHGDHQMPSASQLDAMVATVVTNTGVAAGSASLPTGIEALSDSSYTNMDGRVVSRATLVSREIIAMGTGALPSLIEASTHANPSTRNEVLRLLYFIASKNGLEIEILPVLVRAASDADEDIRMAAVTALCEICARYRQSSDERLRLLVACLKQATSDASERIRTAASEALVALGHEKLAPGSSSSPDDRR